ncbi:MAG: hypothetical protein ACODAJ_11400, partial [Planctomycetota bacterium]
MQRIRLALAIWLTASAALGATAVTVDDQAIVGELIGLDATPTAVLRTEEGVRRIPCADLLAIELRKDEPSPRTGASTVVLRGGRALCGNIAGGSSRAVGLRGPVYGAVKCPLSAIARVEFPVSQPPRPPEAAEKQDRLIFANSDVVDGTVQA